MCIMFNYSVLPDVQYLLKVDSSIYLFLLEYDFGYFILCFFFFFFLLLIKCPKTTL